MVPWFWLIERINMMGIAKNVVNVFGKTINFWRVDLTCGADTPGEVRTKKGGIFQGVVLSPLLYIIFLIPLIHIPRTSNYGN